MSERRRRYHPLVVGSGLGLLAGDVLLGLNPHLLAPSSVARLLLWTGLCGALAGLPVALVPTRTARPSRAAWVVLAALFTLAAVLAESQRTLFYPSLGNGARRVLVAATLAAALAAALAVFLAVRLPDGRTSLRLLGMLLPAFALVPLAGRRATERVGLAPDVNLPRTATRSLLVVGIDGASWDLVSSAASDGSLPFFSRLLREGAAGPLATLAPYERAAVFTSLATGKKPSKHGVVADAVWETPGGSLRLLPRFPDGSRLPVPPFAHRVEGSPSRRSLAFWEILSGRAHNVALLGWPAAGPPGEGLTLWATERFFVDRSADPSVEARPRDAAERARLFCVETANLDRPLVKGLVPSALGRGDEEKAHALDGAARDLTVASATLGSLPTGPRNVSAMVLPGLARVARRYGPAAEPARYWGLPPKDVEARASALRAYYRLLDDILADLMEREGEDRTLCVFSPSGWGPSPPVAAFVDFVRGREPEASPDASHDGFVVLYGSGIRSGVRLTSANVLDLAPTLLVLAGEPIARDMDGRVLAEAFDDRFLESASVPIVTSFERAGPQ